MVRPSTGFNPVKPALNPGNSQPQASGIPGGVTTFGTPGATPGSTPMSTPGVAPASTPSSGTPGTTPGGTPSDKPLGFNPDTIVDNISDLPYAAQVKTLASSITGTMNVDDQTLIDKPALAKFIQEQSSKTNLTKGSQYVLAQARMLYSVTFDATDRWGAKLHGGQEDGKVNVWELTNSKFSDLSPFF